jgi:hypothetical protein
MNIISTVLTEPSKTTDPVPEDALDAIKRQSVSQLGNHLFTFITRASLSISEDFHYYAKEPKPTWAHVWRIGWVRHSRNIMLLEFPLDLRSAITH